MHVFQKLIGNIKIFRNSDISCADLNYKKKIMASQEIPNIASEAVLVKSEPMPADSQKVEGYDFNQGVDHHALLQSYLTSGFQATNFGLAVEQINAMVSLKSRFYK